ncbi:MAG: hypothetical protein RLZZ227_2395 [Pseudomonadota bacterium]|jgi:hypothetical protein
MNKFSLWTSLALLITGTSFSYAANAAITRIEEAHPSVTYQGSWQTYNGSAVSGGSVAATKSAGAAVTVNFSGTGIAWIGYRSRLAGGFARVYIDGVLQTTAGTHATRNTPQSGIFSASGLANGQHVLRIEVTGEMQGTDPAAGDGAYVAIDAFDIDDGQSGQVIEDSAAALTYTGDWIDIADPSVSGGSVRASRSANASVYIDFNGTGIEWIGYRCACAAGVAHISMPERGSLATKHTYAASRYAQAVVYSIDGLAPGPHRLEIDVTGDSVTADPNNAWIVIDAFRVLSGDSRGGGLESTPPLVGITGPQSPVTGTATITASALDTSGIVKVKFYAGATYLGEDSEWPYQVTRDTSNIPSGNSYPLRAQAFDTAGNVADSTPFTVTVNHNPDLVPPTVAITAPVAGALVSGTLAITAEATDNVAVQSVGFYRDRCCSLEPHEQIGPVDTAAPYATSLNTLGMLDGPHKLFARAVDSAGNLTISAPVTMTIDNSVQPGMIRVDDAGAGLVLTGTWTRNDSAEGGIPLFHWGSAYVSETIGATATFTFDGIGVRWISYRCALVCGDATVSIDGGPAQAVSMRGNAEFGERENLARVVYTSPVLTNGRHTLRITVANDHPSRLGAIFVDGFEVITPQ